jgi:hypothetical protein
MDRLINAARTNGSAAPRASGSAIDVGDLTHPGQRFRRGKTSLGPVQAAATDTEGAPS